MCLRRELRVGVFEKEQKEKRIESEKSNKDTPRGKIEVYIYIYIPATYENASCQHNRDTDAACGGEERQPQQSNSLHRPVGEAEYWVSSRSRHRRACLRGDEGIERNHRGRGCVPNRGGTSQRAESTLRVCEARGSFGD